MVDSERMRVVVVVVNHRLTAQPARQPFSALVGCEHPESPGATASVLAAHDAGLGVDAVALHDGHSQTTTPEDAIRLGAGLGGHCLQWCIFVWIMATP